MKFSEFPLHETTHLALEAMGFEETTTVQEQALGPLLEGRDLIGQAQTGTGKTAAFGIPLIEAGRNGRRGLILTPTRELAQQVQREVQAIGKGSPVDVVCLIGGAHFGEQVRAMQRHPNSIIVATPGRILDHMERGTIDVKEMGILVLDEADEMMSMGFQDELEAIVAALPQERQTMLFSATMPPAIEKLAKRAMQDPVMIRTGSGKGATTVTQFFSYVPSQKRADAVRRIMMAEDPKTALLFCRTRQRVQDLADELQDVGAEALHGGMGQPQRDGVMKRVRDGRTRLLVATDVAARGIDVQDIELVLHDDTAGDPETYIHRIGRTGRAGREGQSIVLIRPGNLRRLGPVQRVAGKLAPYTVPSDAEIQALQTQRLVDELEHIEPGVEAIEALAAAEKAGLALKDIALAALSMAFASQMAPEEEEGPDMGGKIALSFKAGKIDGVRPGDLVGLLANEGGLNGDDIGRIDLLPRMSVAEVPAKHAERLCEALARSVVRGQQVRPRVMEDWQFKTPARN